MSQSVPEHEPDPFDTLLEQLSPLRALAHSALSSPEQKRVRLLSLSSFPCLATPALTLPGSQHPTRPDARSLTPQRSTEIHTKTDNAIDTVLGARRDTMLYITVVCTAPAAQGRGYASALLRIATATVRPCPRPSPTLTSEI